VGLRPAQSGALVVAEGSEDAAGGDHGPSSSGRPAHLLQGLLTQPAPGPPEGGNLRPTGRHRNAPTVTSNALARQFEEPSGGDDQRAQVQARRSRNLKPHSCAISPDDTAGGSSTSCSADHLEGAGTVDFLLLYVLDRRGVAGHRDVWNGELGQEPAGALSGPAPRGRRPLAQREFTNLPLPLDGRRLAEVTRTPLTSSFGERAKTCVRTISHRFPDEGNNRLYVLCVDVTARSGSAPRDIGGEPHVDGGGSNHSGATFSSSDRPSASSAAANRPLRCALPPRVLVGRRRRSRKVEGDRDARRTNNVGLRLFRAGQNVNPH